MSKYLLKMIENYNSEMFDSINHHTFRQHTKNDKISKSKIIKLLQKIMSALLTIEYTDDDILSLYYKIDIEHNGYITENEFRPLTRGILMQTIVLNEIDSGDENEILMFYDDPDNLPSGIEIIENKK